VIKSKDHNPGKGFIIGISLVNSLTIQYTSCMSFKVYLSTIAKIPPTVSLPPFVLDPRSNKGNNMINFSQYSSRLSAVALVLASIIGVTAVYAGTSYSKYCDIWYGRGVKRVRTTLQTPKIVGQNIVAI
jgi:hypothetical protein